MGRKAIREGRERRKEEKPSRRGRDAVYMRRRMGRKEGICWYVYEGKEADKQRDDGQAEAVSVARDE